MTNQEIWDSNLIYGWRANIGMHQLVQRFLAEVNPELYDLIRSTVVREELKEINLKVSKYLLSLELRRCRDRLSNGNFTIRFSKKIPIRAFVAIRAKQLNSCLWNENNKTEDILAVINTFKWVRIVSRKSKEQRKNTRDRASTKVISAKNLSYKHNWNTVK